MKLSNITAPTQTTVYSNLSKGLYIVNIKMSDGQVLTQKLSINY